MPIDVKTPTDLQDELRAAIQSVFESNHITDQNLQLGTLIGAAVGYAKSRDVTAGEFLSHVKTCMTIWRFYRV